MYLELFYGQAVRLLIGFSFLGCTQKVLSRVHQHTRDKQVLEKIPTPLQKRANGIPLITIEYHSVSFSNIGPFNDISAAITIHSH